MSLIDDALKRAQGIESVDDAVRRGAAYPFMARNLQDRRRSRRALLLGFLAGGVLASLLAGGMVFWLAGRRAPEPSARAAAAKPPAASPPTSTALPEVVVPPPVVVRAPRRDSAAPGRGGTAPTGKRSERPKSNSAPAVEPAAPRPEAAAPASALGILNGKVYPGEVALSDGRKLALDGIVYSESSPVAMINGRVLGVGSTVGDFAVTKIEADRVQLQGKGIAFTLALK